PRAARALRRPAGALRPLACPERARRYVLPRDAPTARALPDLPARSRSPPARRAVRRARCRGNGAAAPGARRPHGLYRARGHARPSAASLPRDCPPRTRMTGYASDVAALARKDLLLELRSRDTVPAMLLFVVSALVVFH